MADEKNNNKKQGCIRSTTWDGAIHSNTKMVGTRQVRAVQMVKIKFDIVYVKKLRKYEPQKVLIHSIQIKTTNFKILTRSIHTMQDFY